MAMLFSGYSGLRIQSNRTPQYKWNTVQPNRKSKKARQYNGQNKEGKMGRVKIVCNAILLSIQWLRRIHIFFLYMFIKSSVSTLNEAAKEWYILLTCIWLKWPVFTLTYAAQRECIFFQNTFYSNYLLLHKPKHPRKDIIFSTYIFIKIARFWH